MQQLLVSRASRRLAPLACAKHAFGGRAQEAAEELDELQGGGRWKAYAPSSSYDWKRLQTKVGHFDDILLNRAALIENNESLVQSDNSLLWSLRAGLGRDQCGLGHPKLYSHAHVGTKTLPTSCKW